MPPAHPTLAQAPVPYSELQAKQKEVFNYHQAASC